MERGTKWLWLIFPLLSPSPFPESEMPRPVFACMPNSTVKVTMTTTIDDVGDVCWMVDGLVMFGARTFVT